MNRQSFFESYLILAIVIHVVLLGNLYVMLNAGYRVGAAFSALLSVLALIWIIGRIYAISKIRDEQHPMYLSIDQIRAELIKSHDWWTGSQIDELVTRYMAVQQGGYQKWLVDDAKMVEIADEMVGEGGAPPKPEDETG